MEGYVYNIAKNTCHSYRDPYCVEVASDQLGCTKCLDNYQLSINKNCVRPNVQMDFACGEKEKISEGEIICHACLKDFTPH